MLGIDYASVDENKPPDFAAAYAFGVRFAIVRGAFTTTSGHAEPDPTIARDRAAIKAAGMQFGAYMILGWNVDPAEQVATFTKNYAFEPGDLPPSLDVEFPNGIGATGLTPRAALDRIEAALQALQATYPTVMVYTSARVWHEDLDDIDSAACAPCPGWIKVAYPWARKQSPHLESVPATFPVPTPLTAPGAAGAFIEQFQGDALRVPGFSSTIDLNAFRSYLPGTADPRTSWISARLSAAGHPCDREDATTVATAITAFQRERGLDADAIVGPRTFAALCAG